MRVDGLGPARRSRSQAKNPLSDDRADGACAICVAEPSNPLQSCEQAGQTAEFDDWTEEDEDVAELDTDDGDDGTARGHRGAGLDAAGHVALT